MKMKYLKMGIRWDLKSKCRMITDNRGETDLCRFLLHCSMHMSGGGNAKCILSVRVYKRCMLIVFKMLNAVLQ